MDSYIMETLNNKNISPSTFAKRRQIILRLANQIDPSATDISFLNNTKKVVEILNSYANIDTKWNILMHILQTIKSVPTLTTDKTMKTYSNMVEKLKPIRVNKSKTNVKTKKQIAQLEVPLQTRQQQIIERIGALFEKYNVKLSNGKLLKRDVHSLGNKLPNFARELQDLTIISAYVLQPALRGNYSTMRFSTTLKGMNDTDNWMVIGNKISRIYMNQFKNRYALGQTVIELEADFEAIAKIWMSVLSVLSKGTPDYFIHYQIYQNGSIHHIHDEFALLLKIKRLSEKYFQQGLTVDAYRHLWEHKIQTSPEYANMTVLERETIHRKLLHSKRIAELYDLQDPTEQTST